MPDNNSITWRTVVIALITILLTIIGWGFVQIRDMPLMYVSSQSMNIFKQDIKNQFDKFELKQDRFQVKLDLQIEKLGDKIDRLNDRESK